MKKKKHIDFLGIGAQKSGTTWLYENLNAISEFDLLPLKELHYFDRSEQYPSPNLLSKTYVWQRVFNLRYSYSALKTIYINIKEGSFQKAGFFIKWYFSNYDDSWYLSLFKNQKGYTGEISPSYSILNQGDIRRIKELIPEVKLVLMLRNPIHRAWSHYRFIRELQGKPSIGGIDEIKEFMDSPGQTLRSAYKRVIENYTSVFSSKQLLIGFYDAIKDNPQGLMHDVLTHICEGEPISIEHLALDKVVDPSITIDCPTDVEVYLKEKYHDLLMELSNSYGGYFTKWYQETYGSHEVIPNSSLRPTMYLG